MKTWDIMSKVEDASVNLIFAQCALTAATQDMDNDWLGNPDNARYFVCNQKYYIDMHNLVFKLLHEAETVINEVVNELCEKSKEEKQISESLK